MKVRSRADDLRLFQSRSTLSIGSDLVLPAGTTVVLLAAVEGISTVGAGDVVPTTPMGKMIASGLMVLGNPLYARMGERFNRYFLGPDGRGHADDLALTLKRLAEQLGSSPTAPTCPAAGNDP